MIVELSFVYFTCQRTIYIVDVNGCTIRAGYLRKQLIIRVIFVIYHVSNFRNFCVQIYPRPGFSRQTVKVVIVVIDAILLPVLRTESGEEASVASI